MSVLQIFAAISISSLFLFAGLEVNFDELQIQRSILLQHVIIRFLMWLATAFTLSAIFTLPFRSAGIYALALLTPSAGFILDQLNRSTQIESQRIWIRNLVIVSEILALSLMFILLKLDSIQHMSLSAVTLLLLIFGLPLVFKGFTRFIMPHAPDSEFNFLIIVSIIAGLSQKNWGYIT